MTKNSEYINVDKILIIKGRPIVAGLCYHTRVVSQILHVIMLLFYMLYPRDFVDYFVCNYFRFLDDIFHTWLINFDIEPSYKLINELDPELKFVFEKLTTDINFLDINIKTVDNQLHFDIYHKPTNSFSYLKYNSCHPSHTKNNISLSLARCIIRIVTDNGDYRLGELRQNLLKRNHLENIINYSFTKCFQPKNNKEENKKLKLLQEHITQIIILITAVSVIA